MNTENQAVTTQGQLENPPAIIKVAPEVMRPKTALEMMAELQQQLFALKQSALQEASEAATEIEAELVSVVAEIDGLNKQLATKLDAAAKLKSHHKEALAKAEALGSVDAAKKLQEWYPVYADVNKASGLQRGAVSARYAQIAESVQWDRSKFNAIVRDEGLNSAGASVWFSNRIKA